MKALKVIGNAIGAALLAGLLLFFFLMLEDVLKY